MRKLIHLVLDCLLVYILYMSAVAMLCIAVTLFTWDLETFGRCAEWFGAPYFTALVTMIVLSLLETRLYRNK